ncbi:hypothetical protein CDAR_463871 [Caerostris darwini]|uniref:Uncharacterized protein n=1 Tax=Caerostris darwini TaxID=1538125 RepID=A0AAV4RX03_9ARAC|nr:hypothetical protein CDAR_463871 [Caerostris darwini]
MASTLTTVFFIALCLTQNTGCYADCCKFANCEKQSNMRECVKETASQSAIGDLLAYGLKTAVVAGTMIVGASVLATAAGFGAGGIAAGSLAAAVQGAWFGGQYYWSYWYGILWFAKYWRRRFRNWRQNSHC